MYTIIDRSLRKVKKDWKNEKKSQHHAKFPNEYIQRGMNVG